MLKLNNLSQKTFAPPFEQHVSRARKEVVPQKESGVALAVKDLIN